MRRLGLGPSMTVPAGRAHPLASHPHMSPAPGVESSLSLWEEPPLSLAPGHAERHTVLADPDRRSRHLHYPC